MWFLGVALAIAGCKVEIGNTDDEYGGGNLTVDECRQFFEHSLRITDTPRDTQTIEEAATACSQNNMLSREHFDCAMAATDFNTFQACKVTLDATGGSLLGY